MKKSRGFTLIELLIVVAIIAILAAIAVPNFLEAQVRAKVSRVKSDMRSIATAIEAYCVDTNQYPAAKSGDKSINWFIPGKNPSGNAKNRVTFASMQFATNPKDHFLTLTTPVSYMTTIPTDPFADTKGCNFGYTNAVDIGWIMWSYGPDTDEATNLEKAPAAAGSQIDYELQGSWDSAGSGIAAWNAAKWAACTVYNPFKTNPLPGLLFHNSRQPDAKTAFTYDTTNGSVSDGDLWRFAGE